MPARVRAATEADLPRIVELLRQLAPEAPDREDASTPLPFAYHLAFRQIAATAGLTVFVIEDRKRIVGTAALCIIPNLSHQGTPYAIVENVVVDERARGKRYGETLTAHLVDVAREAGCYKVSLTSNKRRSDAHRFYERLGFKGSHEGFRVSLRD